ncbi:Vegetative incompatibility protein HET-E-1 [Fusarium oxysporum f. sp. albedinis]|nr:Vegetative incompatibility protein HET-E-1 [Fusarium oxysporum f. sp. albedinis]
MMCIARVIVEISQEKSMCSQTLTNCITQFGYSQRLQQIVISKEHTPIESKQEPARFSRRLKDLRIDSGPRFSCYMGPCNNNSSCLAPSE